MKVIVYAKLNFLEPHQVSICETWCRRRRLRVDQRVTEFADTQKKLRRLVSSLRQGDLLVFPSFRGTASTSLLLKAISKLLEKEVRVVFVDEHIDLRPRTKQSAAYRLFTRHLLKLERDLRVYRQRRGIKLAQLCRVPVGRERLSDDLRSRAETLVREGWSVRKVAQKLDGKVSKSWVQGLRASLKKRTD